MNTATVLAIIQIVAMASKCGQDVMDLIERAKRGEEIPQAELDTAMENVLKSQANLHKAAGG